MVTHNVHDKRMEDNQPPPGGFLSKSAVPGLMNVAGDTVPPDQLDSLPDDFASLREDHRIHKPGSNALKRGSRNLSVSVGGPKVSAVSATGTVPHTLQISPAMAQKINSDIKYQLMKEVRKFGRSK